MKKRAIQILLLIAVLSSCTRNEFVGKWENPNIALTLENNSTFKWSYKKSAIELEGLYHINKDTITLETQHDFSLTFHFQLLNNSLVMWNYKDYSGELKGHIDEVFVLKSDSNNKSNEQTSEVLESFILPPAYIGPVYINYAEGNDDISNHKKRQIIIPESGLVKTEMKESILNLAFGNYRFKSADKEYKFIIDDGSEETELQKYNVDSVYVCVYGFNQEGRSEINKIFNEKIKGNVLMLEVDTLKNLIPKMRKY